MPSLLCCSSVNPTLKSKLKSPPNDDAQGNVQPIRRLYACSFARGARDTAMSVTSWFAKWMAKPLKPSAIIEQDGQPAADRKSTRLNSSHVAISYAVFCLKKKI